METHESDPTAETGRDPWDDVSSEFSDIGHRLRDTYRRVAKTRGPTDQEIRTAFSTLAAAWDQVAESLSTALKDPRLREQLKDAASTFATALGATVSELGSELKKTTFSSSKAEEE